LVISTTRSSFKASDQETIRSAVDGPDDAADLVDPEDRRPSRAYRSERLRRPVDRVGRFERPTGKKDRSIVCREGDAVRRELDSADQVRSEHLLGGVDPGRPHHPPLGLPVVQLAMRGDAVGLALTAHGSIAFTVDDGARWSLAPAPGEGARGVLLDDERLLADTASGAFAFRAEGRRWERIAPLESHAFRLFPPHRSAKLEGATAIRDRRGALANGRWLEVTPLGDDGWGLQASKLGDPPAVGPRPELAGCTRAWLAAAGTDVWLACTKRDEENVVRVLESGDEGQRFYERIKLVTRYPDDLRIFALSGGALLVQGACPADDRAACPDPSTVPEEEQGFLSSNPKLLLSRAVSREIASTTSMEILAAARNDADGTVYALGTREAGSMYLLTSRDEGSSVSTEGLPDVDVCDPTDHLPVAFAVDGRIVVAIVYGGADRWLRYSSTDSGAHFQASLLPIEGCIVALSGRRGLAVRFSGGGWETADFGATWTPVPTPWTVQEAGPGNPEVACTDGGCLIDASAVRLGWELP
jgi:hypothetical protein